MNPPPRRRLDGGVLWTTALSVVAHGALLFLIVAGPNRYLRAATPPLESYTVELVTADALGGDSGPLGAGSEPEPVAEPPVEAVPEPVAEEAPVEAEDEVLAEPEPEVVPEELEEPVEVEPEPVAEFEPAEEPEPEPEVEPEPELAEEAEPEAVEEAESEIAAGEAEPEVVEIPVEKAEPAESAEPGPVKAEVPDEPKPVAVAKPTPRRAKAAATRDVAAERDRRIAEAVQGRAKQDDPIAAAVRRRAKKLAAGGSGGDGPLASGPGSGIGGVIRGTEYILYKRRMESRIRGAWVWAGKDDRLESVVRFSIAPDGEIDGVRTIRSSGDTAYDASAERAVRAAGPLGIVPEAYRSEFANVEMTFRARDLQR